MSTVILGGFGRGRRKLIPFMTVCLFFLAAFALTILSGILRETDSKTQFENATPLERPRNKHPSTYHIPLTTYQHPETSTQATQTSAATTTAAISLPVPSVRPLRTGADCYRILPLDHEHIDMLPDILLNEDQARDGSNIFFHDTSCLNGLVKLKTRQACSIESAAKANPHSQIWTLFTSPVGFWRHEEKSRTIQALLTYPNIHFRNLNIWKYAEGTPAENWIYKPDLFNSHFLSPHVADFLRLLSLYRFGGTYLDLDFMVRESLANLSRNFVSVESKNYIANSALKFERDTSGNGTVETMIKEFVAHFDGSVWGANGPALVTRIVKEVCETEDLIDCARLTVYPENTFFPLFYPRWQMLFNPNQTEEVMQMVSKSTAVHLWNALTADTPVRLGENTAFEMMAKQFCPRVYASIHDQKEF